MRRGGARSGWPQPIGFTSISKETVPSTSAAEVTPIVVFFFDFFFLASATCVGASEATSEAASAEDDIENVQTREELEGVNSVNTRGVNDAPVAWWPAARSAAG